ncbi:MAG: DnaB-like helicase N-terminal domain-containing protein, partial [Lentisphaeria bacterium]
MAEDDKKKISFKPSGLLTGDRPLPHDNNAEVAVLGSILLSPEDAIDVGGKLPVTAFYNERHRVIFKTLMALHSEPEKPAIDLITLIDSLRRRGDLNKAGGEEYLVQVMNSMPTAANIEAYTEIVMENYILRRLISSGSDIIERSFSQTTSVKELMDQIEQDIMEIGNVQTGNEYVTMGELMPEVMMHIKQMMMGNQEATGLDSGFIDLNKMIYGFRPQNMIVLAARPSIGKTALALNFAANVAIETANPKP